jgi:hypothetical protein
MRERLYVAGILAAIGLLAAVVIVVFALGRHDPSPPSLERNPNLSIPGRLVFVTGSGCIVVAEASGAAREDVYCSALHIYQVTWVDENTIVFANPDARSGPGGTAIDLRTRESRPHAMPALAFPSPVSIHGEEVGVDQDGRVQISSQGRITTIAAFDTPRHVIPSVLTWSPDGEWILLEYYPPRSGGSELWIISRDGTVQGTLATGVRGSGASWWIDGYGFTPATR